MTALKTIVVCLALANVGYFLWARGIAGPQAVAPVPTAPSTLKLASEAATDPRGAAAAAAPADSNGVAGTTVAASTGSAKDQGTPDLLAHVDRCITVGPFRDVSEAAHAASTLRGGGYDPRQRVVDGDVWAGVWVYIPLPTGRAAIDQMLAKLKAVGIEDALEMPGPVDGSVISLGLFSEQKRAQARVAQVQALGLSPGMADRKRTGNVYWIDIELKPTDAPLNAADLQGDAGRITRLEVKACPAPPPAQP